MKAAVLRAKDEAVEVTEWPAPEAGEDEVVIRLHTTALNRRDYWITKGLYPGITYPIIMGSDGCGEVDGKMVIINPNQDWGSRPEVQGKNYHILGLPDNGTFAEYVKVKKDRIVEKPAHLTEEQAAALPLAGMTAYRALFTKCRPEKGEKLLVTGVGGGVAVFVLQFAVAAGLEVYVTSGSDEKISEAVALGAKGGANYKKEDWDKELKEKAGGFDIVIDSAGGKGFSQLLQLCNPGGRVAIYGGTQGKIPEISPQLIFWRQLSIYGSTMATDAEFSEMVSFVNKHRIVPVTGEILPLEDISKALLMMEKNIHFGKIILQC